MTRDLTDLTPKEIVAELDKFIIGQEAAKKAVAIALRNRVRRRKLPEELRDEVAPKNIIMIGPTGVGKTEIARRLSKLTGAPFVKVEATKYTEVGYVGRDVESMVRDLVTGAVSMVREELQEEVRQQAESRTEEQLLDLLLPGNKPAAEGEEANPTREKFREKLREGIFDDKEVEIQVSGRQMPAIEIFSGSNFEEMDLNLGNLSSMLGGRKKRKKTAIKQAREIIMQEEMDRLVDSDRVNELARDRVEQMGIIFIDEIDKIASKESRSGVDVSREGVQRDILPIVEGSRVNTKYGTVDTSHILFIAAGAFHMSKPSDLIPELQGRFPLRVELEALDADDFVQILTQPKNALSRQYHKFFAYDGVDLVFQKEALQAIAKEALKLETGARGLRSIIESALTNVMFELPSRRDVSKCVVTREVIEKKIDPTLVTSSAHEDLELDQESA